MMRVLVFTITAFMAVSATSVHALTDSQAKGMYRHGIWEWSIQNCSGISRGRRYWYYLKELGEFDSVREITKNQGGHIFNSGWQYMQDHANKFGITKVCDYAKKNWSAMLWSSKSALIPDSQRHFDKAETSRNY